MIAAKLREHTSEISNYDTRRNYVSLSNIALPIDDIIKQYQYGYDDSLDIRLKCYKGYQMEKDLLQRIKACFPERFAPGGEISVHNGLVQGHPDFSFDGFPADCKSVLLDEWMPVNGKLPRKVYWQMQAYMLYTKKDRALVIYESRQSGRLEEYWIKANASIQMEIDTKIDMIVAAVK